MLTFQNSLVLLVPLERLEHLALKDTLENADHLVSLVNPERKENLASLGYLESVVDLGLALRAKKVKRECQHFQRG